MENQFDKVMSSKTNEELIKIITLDRDNYQQLAIVSAENELKRRNIPTSDINNISQDIIEKEKRNTQIENNTVSSGIRFINFIIDSFAWLIIVSILTLPFKANNNMEMLFVSLLLLITNVLYYLIFEITTRKTLGKIVTKTRVVNYSGEEASNGDIVIRTLMRLVPFDCISYLFTRNGIHDMLSKTKVIKDK
ncbi:MAG: RDD family protein [Dysgonomonas sp.]